MSDLIDAVEFVKNYTRMCTAIENCEECPCIETDFCKNVSPKELDQKDAEEVVLPCKVGDTVYSIFGAEVIEKTVGRVIINGYTTPRIWVDLDCSFLSSMTKRWDLGIGKDFFLTREEAEKALEEAKHGNQQEKA